MECIRIFKKVSCKERRCKTKKTDGIFKNECEESGDGSVKVARHEFYLSFFSLKALFSFVPPF